VSGYPPALLAAPLVANLAPPQRAELLAAAASRRLERGEFLFHEADPAEAFFLLASGSLKLVRFTQQGKEMLVHLVRAGQIFAEAVMFGPRTYSVSAVALELSEVWLWSRVRLLELVRQSRSWPSPWWSRSRSGRATWWASSR
jgi:CRP/FNR family transcriptional regulator